MLVKISIVACKLPLKLMVFRVFIYLFRELSLQLAIVNRIMHNNKWRMGLKLGARYHDMGAFSI